jgi:hypothetical protein
MTTARSCETLIEYRLPKFGSAEIKQHQRVMPSDCGKLSDERAAPGFCKGHVVGQPYNLMRILGDVLVFVIESLSRMGFNLLKDVEIAS